MGALLLEPHHDDAALFAAFTCLRYRPLVVTVLGDAQVQRRVGIDGDTRSMENRAAMLELGCEWEEWPFTDRAPPWQLIEENLTRMVASGFFPVFAPAPHNEGHEQHTMIGMLALQVFGPDRVQQYCTYYDGRSRQGGTPVEFEPWMIRHKLRALACYGSQHAEPSCAHHFTDHGLREWML